MMNEFVQFAKEHLSDRKKEILPVPEVFKIDPKFLGELSNSQFCDAFHSLQKLVIDIYDDAYNSPYDWGFPDFKTTDGYYNRIMDFLFAFVNNGSYNSGTLNVNRKMLYADKNFKRHKKPELMVSGFTKMGFVFNGFSKKTENFNITYPDNSHILIVLCTYLKIHAGSSQSWNWNALGYKCALSYRYIEDPATQEYETIFHVLMDYAPKMLQEIQRWLHTEAGKYGYKLNPKEPQEKCMMLYQKGSKRFLLVGNGWIKLSEMAAQTEIKSKVIFRRVFETHKEQVERLSLIFPDTFKSNCRFCDSGKEKKCSMRVSYELFGKKHNNCAYNSFWFTGVTLGNIGELLELFKIENKIK